MNIVVCLKQVLDPEMTPKDFKVDPATRRPVRGNARMVIDSYSENALEAAVQLKAKVPGSKVTILCLGDKPADEALRRALAFTADAAVRAWDPAWTDLDAGGTAHVLAQTIRQLGADLVLCGRQASDIEQGLVGPFLADELEANLVTMAARIEPDGNMLQVHREIDGGFATLAVALPAVLTVTNDQSNVPRLPKVKDTMLAMSKPIRLVGAGELALSPDRLQPGVVMEELSIPSVEAHCELVAGDDGPAKAAALTRRLQAMQLWR